MVSRDQNGHITPAFSGPPGAERSITSPMLFHRPMVGGYQHGYRTASFSGSPWWGEINMATSPVPSWGPNGGGRSKWPHQVCRVGVPLVGNYPYGCITLAFLGSINLHHPNLLGVPMVGGYQNGYITPGFSGPHGGERSIWPQDLYLLGVPMVGNYPYGYITLAF